MMKTKHEEKPLPDTKEQPHRKSFRRTFLLSVVLTAVLLALLHATPSAAHAAPSPQDTDDATLNIIKDYRVLEKRRVELPDRLEGVVRCFNPSCVTNQQPVSTCFEVLMSSPPTLRCVYCERVMTGNDITLK